MSEPLHCESARHPEPHTEAVNPFQCTRCERWFCARCEGSDLDPEYCDACWEATQMSAAHFVEDPP